MNSEIPETHKDLLAGPVYVQLASHMRNGSIQVHPVWCGYDGTHILVNSAKGRVKDRNMRTNPNVTVLAVDPENPFRWLEIRGKVVDISEEGADEHIDQLSDLYIQQSPYPWREAGEVRVIYRVEPERIIAFST